MKKTLLCVLLCLMGCFFLSGCQGKVPEPYGIMEPTEALYEGLDLLKPNAAQAQNDAQTQETYTIVVDDGFGMKGFISTFCLSYRAAITAATSVSMSHESTCIRASDLLSGTQSTEKEASIFFQTAVQDQFFREKSNDAAAVIERMAKSYRDNPNQVMILISDLMIPTEDDCMKAAKALKDAVITPEHATMGLIGVVGDFRGTIENLPVSPTTGYKRKIGDYMVLERDEKGNFRHPLYLLFLGDDQAVLSAMQKAISSLDSSKLLDGTTPYYALYFSEYDIARRESDDIFSEFNLGCQDYNAADYSARFLVRGMKNKEGKVKYPASIKARDTLEFRDAELQLLNKLPIAKLYDLERGNTEKNVKVRCTIPFTLLDSTQGSETILDQHGLVVPAAKLSLAHEDYSVSAQMRVLQYTATDGNPQATWVTPSAALMRCESAEIDATGKKIELVLSVNTTLLKKDEPFLCQVGVCVGLQPQWQEISALYDTSWVDELTLNLKSFDSESIQFGTSESSARYTAASTAKTPFLSNLICDGIAGQQIQIIADGIRQKTEACVQTTLFGMVVRDVPNKYLSNSTWEEKEDFDGWAFSITDAERIRAAID